MCASSREKHRAPATGQESRRELLWRAPCLMERGCRAELQLVAICGRSLLRHEEPPTNNLYLHPLEERKCVKVKFDEK